VTWSAFLSKGTYPSILNQSLDLIFQTLTEFKGITSTGLALTALWKLWL